MDENEAARNKQRKHMTGVLAGVLAVAYVGTLFVTDIRQQREAFRAGYAQACADIRSSIVTRLYDEKPFRIAECGILFKRTGDRTFTVWFDDQGPAVPRPVHMADRLIGR